MIKLIIPSMLDRLSRIFKQYLWAVNMVAMLESWLRDVGKKWEL
jgi:hypothetical protein